MTAKRALNFGTPSTTKRRRTMAPTIVVRGTKGEMKTLVTNISHSATTLSNTLPNEVAGGSDNGQRVGNRIKIWRVECTVSGSSACKATLTLPYKASATSLASSVYNGFVTQTDGITVFTRALNPGASADNVHYINYKFPMGLVTRFGSSTSSDIEKNRLIFALSSPSATLNGAVRIWYTDV